MDRKFYDNEQEIDRLQEKALAKKSQKLILFRMISFFGILFSAAAGYDGWHPLFYGLAVIFVLAFAWLIHVHDRTKREELFVKSRLSVLGSYLARIHGTWRTRSFDGHRYLAWNRPQDVDLHVFGPGSLYQYVCSARTKLGRDRLAKAFSPEPPDFAKVRIRQRGIAELMERPRLSLDLEALGRLLPNDHDTSGLIEVLEQEPPSPSYIYHLRWGIPFLFVLALAMAFAGMTSWLLVGLIPVISCILTGIATHKTSDFLAPLQNISRELYLYDEIFRRVEATEFTGSTLRWLRSSLQTGVSAARALHRLSFLTELIGLRRNMFCYVLGNAFLMLDFHCVVMFLAWRGAASRHIRRWMKAHAELEVLLSLASIGRTRETVCFPLLLEGSAPQLRAKSLTSLLIHEPQAVPNDAELSSGTYIITGSNMSGKTTWIRSLAGAVMLAYAGAPVCAESFAVSGLSLFTSIRVNDDISQGLSTFYAELLRIKSMVEYSEKRLPMFIVIDEIFKGTNSADRILGAQEAIRRLTNGWSITLVTTHDFELCDLSSPNDIPITNCHFEESYEEDKIRFDFKLKPGRCHTTNAKYLLKMAGILKDG